MDALTWFGLIAVSLMLITYTLEARSNWYILAFALACLLGSAYGFLQGAWPFGVVEAVWAVVAAKRWWQSRALDIGARRGSLCPNCKRPLIDSHR